MIKPSLRLASPRAALTASLIMAMTSAVHSQPAASADSEIPADALKQIYLACERAAAMGDMVTDEIMRCSIVYEELKRRVFGGDFQRLKTWSDAQLAFAPQSSVAGAANPQREALPGTFLSRKRVGR